MKIISLLNVVSRPHSQISLIDFISQCNDSAGMSSMSRDEIMKLDLAESLALCYDIEVTDAQSKSLIFIAGYVGFKLCRSHQHCNLCKSEIVSDQTLELDMPPDHCEYLMDLDRGGLKWPTDLLVEDVTQTFRVFQCILTEEYESQLLASGNQKSVLLCLFNERLKICGILEGECICGLNISELLKPAQPIVANIFFEQLL